MDEVDPHSADPIEMEDKVGLDTTTVGRQKISSGSVVVCSLFDCSEMTRGPDFRGNVCFRERKRERERESLFST